MRQQGNFRRLIRRLRVQAERDVAVEALIEAAKPFCDAESCNRIKYGKCEVLACLQRGGYVRGQRPGNYDQATCEAYALAQAIAAVEHPQSATSQADGAGQ